MTPAIPPFPTPLNLPFQLSNGNQTSKLIAGSVTPTTLQKAGVIKLISRPGRLKLFASTISTEAIVVFSRSKELLVSSEQAFLRSDVSCDFVIDERLDEITTAKIKFVILSWTRIVSDSLFLFGFIGELYGFRLSV